MNIYRLILRLPKEKKGEFSPKISCHDKTPRNTECSSSFDLWDILCDTTYLFDNSNHTINTIACHKPSGTSQDGSCSIFVRRRWLKQHGLSWSFLPYLGPSSQNDGNGRIKTFADHHHRPSSFIISALVAEISEPLLIDFTASRIRRRRLPREHRMTCTIYSM